MRRIPFLFLAIFAVFGGIMAYFASPVGTRGEFTAIEIKKGEGLKEIAGKLKKAGIIRSAELFGARAFFTGSAGHLKPGNYVFYYGDAFGEIEKVLLKGPSDIEATILPGMTLKEIDDKLSSLKIIEKGALLEADPKDFEDEYPFLKGLTSLEGLLLPDTYFFLGHSKPETVINRFLENFQAEVLPFLKKGDNLYTITTLASIIEKEIPDYDEQMIGAGVLEKRLALGMPLQVDVSVIYAKCSGQYLDCPPLSRSDFSIKSPYNTYSTKGLPPTPISNPSVSTIKAVLNAAKTSYLFYLSDPETNKTIFSKTFDEHNKNRIKYLGE